MATPVTPEAMDEMPLTRRQQEVAALIGQALTNRRIAERLFISERMVHTHVADILGKLGMATRAEIAVWAVARGLVGTGG